MGTAKIERMLSESIGVQMVKDKRHDLEKKGQLQIDQLAKLAQIVAKGGAQEHKGFWVALAKRIVGEGEAEAITTDLSSVGRAAFEAAFPGGSGGPDFPEFSIWKEQLLKEIKKPGSVKEELLKKKKEERKR